MNVPPWLPFLVRPLIAVFTRSFFQPDEYFQALEPAHLAVFGYGHLTWEWVVQPPIRSIAYPAVWMPIYYLLKVFGLDNGPFLTLAPKLFAGVLAAFTDFYAWKLATKLYGKKIGSVTVVVSLSSVFHALALSRTLSNSLETALTIVALYYWPLNKAKSNLVVALTFAGLACLIRPTSVITWAYLFAELTRRSLREGTPLVTPCFQAVSLGTAFLLSQVGLDSLYYGKLTFTLLNFLNVNLSSVSSFYGANRFHYYLVEAIPVLCGTALPYSLYGAFLAYRRPDPAKRVSRILLGLSSFTIAVYSLAGHKEWRFIHPLLPIFHMFAARAAVTIYQRSKKAKRRGTRNRLLYIRNVDLVVLLSGLPAIIYVVYFHSFAQTSVMHHLRSVPTSELRSIGFLMPCHSTPWQAYIHRPDVDMWAIGCEPPLRGQNLSTYRDQTTVFYENPVAYIQDRFPTVVDPDFPPSPMPCSPPGVSEVVDWKHSWPSHLVAFGALLKKNPEMEALLKNQNYEVVWQSGNGWEEDDRRRGGIQVWCWTGLS